MKTVEQPRKSPSGWEAGFNETLLWISAPVDPLSVHSMVSFLGMNGTLPMTLQIVLLTTSMAITKSTASVAENGHASQSLHHLTTSFASSVLRNGRDRWSARVMKAVMAASLSMPVCIKHTNTILQSNHSYWDCCSNMYSICLFYYVSTVRLPEFQCAALDVRHRMTHHSFVL